MSVVCISMIAALFATSAQPISSKNTSRETMPPPASDVSVSPSDKFTPAPMPASTNGNPHLTPAQRESAMKQALNLRQTGSNSFQIGLVEFDKRLRTVSLSARVAIRTQAVEYALVNQKGKAYESLLTTEAAPSDVHIAFLLLGVNRVPVDGVFNTAASVPQTNSLQIDVVWENNGKPTHAALCDLMCLMDEGNERPPRPLGSRAWLYNGSVIDDFGFDAQREGSIIAVIRDSAALINNPAEDRDNDRIHFPNTKLLPAEGSLVRIVLHLPEQIAPPVRHPPAPSGVTPITPLSTNCQ